MSLALIAKIIIGIGFISTLYFIAYAGEPDKLAWWQNSIVMLVALIAPFFLFWLMQEKMVHNNTQQWLLLVSATIYSLGGLSLMYKAFMVNPVAQGGLIMVVIPVYGSALIILTAIILLFTRKL